MHNLPTWLRGNCIALAAVEPAALDLRATHNNALSDLGFWLCPSITVSDSWISMVIVVRTCEEKRRLGILHCTVHLYRD
jgi:hypothetical protein